jgi:hypothetical protein
VEQAKLKKKICKHYKKSFNSMRKLNTEKIQWTRRLKPRPTDVINVTDQFITTPLDMDRLVDEVKIAESIHPYTKKASGGWTSIPLRSAGGMIGESASDALGIHASSNPAYFKNTNVMQPYINEIITCIGGNSILKVRLMKLEAGRKIPEHIDKFEGKISTFVKRYHIPIITNPKIDFFVNHKRYYLEPGQIYTIDVSQFHSVENNSDIDRVHLVFDVV